VVDVFLEIWALFVVTAIAGSFAAFFGGGCLVGFGRLSGSGS
jgi:hypothetical protein